MKKVYLYFSNSESITLENISKSEVDEFQTLMNEKKSIYFLKSQIIINFAQVCYMKIEEQEKA